MTNRNYISPFPFLHAISLLSHRTRIGKFNSAIEQYVDADSVVVDIGSGSGILGMLAAQAGARKVVCVDINEKSVEYSRSVARRNKLDANMEFVVSDFRDFVAEEKADVVICEMLSSFMLIEQQVPAAIHAKKHILKTDGIILPNHIRIYAVPVECNTVWSRFRREAIAFMAVPQTVERGAARDLANLVLVKEFTFNSNDESLAVDELLDFTICSNGILHGFLGMFEADLSDDIRLNMEDGWKEILMPIESPIPLLEGQSIRTRIRFTPGEYDTLRLNVERGAQ